MATADVGLVTIVLSMRVSALKLIAIPVAIIGTVISTLSVAVTALFLRDKLCKIAFFINLASLLVSIVSIIIWFVAL